ncbi:putative spermidine/putrescine transport system ATP-binding protein [Roseomonas rosea]|uniref:Putative spermidine/putrescine transport system ATP-binding protein n=1 Tax=Muricoccus roseus TaxID=198092 RepID=A0A1M6H511_9PROT|nr:ABC transporter ATP-binding protein [Roseomonas rosea]SHJ17303.1 putative spermidine/putrescine transport system ATP-binding protein [Roseomonas rosea]
MTKPYLELKNLSKSYDGRHRALDSVDLTAAKGEFITFLGPSGSGKTTTLMLIAGFEAATEGEILVDGVSITRVPPHKRGIGIVFQNYALFPHRTALQNVLFPLQMRKLPKAQATEKARAMLALVGLDRFADRHPREMSGGQQQRVALARALVFDPALLLLDEPLGALDKNLRENLQIEIKRIQRSLGVTTIFVTHDQSEAMAMSDRIVVFEGGRIQQAGTPLEIYDRPVNDFVARFVGDSNLLPLRFTDPAAGLGEIPGIGAVRIPAQPAHKPGQAATLLLRPEVLGLAQQGAENTCRMRVETVVHFGDSALLIGQAGGTPLRARLPGHAAQGIAENTDIGLSWNAAAGHLIPAD